MGINILKSSYVDPMVFGHTDVSTYSNVTHHERSFDKDGKKFDLRNFSRDSCPDNMNFLNSLGFKINNEREKLST